MMDRILLLGSPIKTQVGGAIESAARRMGIEVKVCDTKLASSPGVWGKISWHLLDRRRGNQSSYEKQVLLSAERFRPKLSLMTGICPVNRGSIERLQSMGITCVNFLTDDPFNAKYRSRWFLKALTQYDTIFTPRYANIPDLQSLGCRKVEYLRFGYNPDIHYPLNDGLESLVPFPVLFVGGADNDRVPFVHALVDSGINVTAYGGYWERYPRAGLTAAGLASASELRRATASARLTLVLVRRANRDGHVMRTFESAASKSCLLVEKTREHVEIFGSDDQNVRYFHDIPSLVQRAKTLLNSPDDQLRLASAAYQHIAVNQKNTYSNRLEEILKKTSNLQSQ